MTQELVAGIVLYAVGAGLMLAPVNEIPLITEKLRAKAGAQSIEGFSAVIRALGVLSAVLGSAFLIRNIV